MFWRVVRGPVHGHLDREHVRVVDRLLDEPLDAGRERLVRIVDEHVARAHRGEHVGLVVLVPGAGAERGIRDRRPGDLADVRMTIESGDLPQIAQVEQPLDVVHLYLVDPEPFDQPRAHRRVHAGADLEPHDLAEAPAPKLVLDRLEEVVGLVGHLEVGVARDPEHVVAEDVHPGEQGVQVTGDDLLERDQRVGRDLDEPRQDLLRDLDARVDLLVEIGVVQPHDQAERQVRDIGERTAVADRERRQHREDLLAEMTRDQALWGGGLLAADDPDAVLGELGPHDLGELPGLAAVELAHLLGHALEHL
jgi:hypothetical protein